MDQSGIDDLLQRHHRQTWRPWLCICGLRHPCSPRRIATEEQVRLDTRARMEVVMRQLREQADQERHQLLSVEANRWQPPASRP